MSKVDPCTELKLTFNTSTSYQEATTSPKQDNDQDVAPSIQLGFDEDSTQPRCIPGYPRQGGYQTQYHTSSWMWNTPTQKYGLFTFINLLPIWDVPTHIWILNQL